MQRGDFSDGERVRDRQERGLLEERGAGGDEAGGEDGLAFVWDVEDHEEGFWVWDLHFGFDMAKTAGEGEGERNSAGMLAIILKKKQKE